MKRIVLVFALLIGACHKDQVPGPTAEQADQLNDADAMLDNLSANEEGPETTNAPGPSSNSD